MAVWGITANEADSRGKHLEKPNNACDRIICKYSRRGQGGKQISPFQHLFGGRQTHTPYLNIFIWQAEGEIEAITLLFPLRIKAREVEKGKWGNRIKSLLGIQLYSAHALSPRILSSAYSPKCAKIVIATVFGVTNKQTKMETT